MQDEFLKPNRVLYTEEDFKTLKSRLRLWRAIAIIIGIHFIFGIILVVWKMP